MSHEIFILREGSADVLGGGGGADGAKLMSLVGLCTFGEDNVVPEPQVPRTNFTKQKIQIFFWISVFFREISATVGRIFSYVLYACPLVCPHPVQPHRSRSDLFV